MRALPGKEAYRIVFPRVEGYTQAIRNRIAIDWASEPSVALDAVNIPPEVQVKAGLPANSGRPSLFGPGKLKTVSLSPFRKNRRKQELIFDLASVLMREVCSQKQCEIPVHALFPQVVKIVDRYLNEKVRVQPPANVLDIFLSPYYGWVIERLMHAIRPDTAHGETAEIPKYERHRRPGSTDEVDFWTSRDVREVERSHVNFVVADTKKWEQSAAYFIDTHPACAAFVKNSGLGFAIPYFHNGQPHDYMPDFIIRLKIEQDETAHLILETKGFDPLEEVKRAAAERWVKAVNADRQYGFWHYAVARRPEEIPKTLNDSAALHNP